MMSGRYSCTAYPLTRYAAELLWSVRASIGVLVVPNLSEALISLPGLSPTWLTNNSGYFITHWLNTAVIYCVRQFIGFMRGWSPLQTRSFYYSGNWLSPFNNNSQLWAVVLKLYTTHLAMNGRRNNFTRFTRRCCLPRVHDSKCVTY